MVVLVLGKITFFNPLFHENLVVDFLFLILSVNPLYFISTIDVSIPSSGMAEKHLYLMGTCFTYPNDTSLGEF